MHRIGRTGRAGRDGVAVTLAEARESRLLKNIEQFTKRKISIESVPSVHDLRARRLELMQTALEETLAGGNLDVYRRVVEALATDHDVLDVAAAAAKLADEARDGAADDEQDIPKDTAFVQPPSERPRFVKAHPDAAERMRSADMTRIFIDLGRNAGIRPGDLVGAITNEAKIDARQVGAIDIADKFSLVEVSNASVDNVIAVLRGTKIRGKSVTARRDRKVKGVR
jgi:ATP-dependent RNA helicase DeaD